MNLYQAQKHAEKNGHDSEEFVALFPRWAEKVQVAGRVFRHVHH